MSYEVWGENDHEPTDHLIEMGWWDPDQVEELKVLIGFVEFNEPRPGNKSDAALILIDHLVHGSRGDPNDPHLVWARKLIAEPSAQPEATVRV